MTQLTRRAVTTALTLMPLALAAHAGAVPYELQAKRSTVGFIYRLSGKASKGSMPVKRAAVVIDFDALQRSSIDVEVDVRRARTGFIFATEALKAATVLDAKAHPTIRFRSTAIRLNGKGRLSDGARIDGLLTIKGITKPVTLQAALFRQAGTQAGDLSQLSFQLKGRISRAAFGAAGFADLVADEIDLDIIARVKRA
ncbi:Polyisoprenoid-binding protein YceI [Litoreibacter ascidiaceicola]|uniref:Polyisoprenoid-binding protein YceI n=1 Tax=Litoreibacter ascidiaceicola TaxID=1486859 RepID=A0A1M4YCF8_9RHOB|nr:YceI family protein [Litoreibacter ascidiaceicola]SHF03420.1 Polyisoprenoid-binding protein YceI [Litoreibacter ascidiaceicola]